MDIVCTAITIIVCVMIFTLALVICTAFINLSIEAIIDTLDAINEYRKKRNNK